KIPLDDVQADKKTRPTNTWQTIKRIGTYLLDDKWKLFLVIIMVIASARLGLLGPYLIGTAIDDVIVTKESTGLITLIIWLLIIFIDHSPAIFCLHYWMLGIAQNTVFRLRKEHFS